MGPSTCRDPGLGKEAYFLLILWTSVVDPDPHQSDKPDPDPRQSHRLDSDPHPHQFADDKPKCTEYETISRL